MPKPGDQLGRYVIQSTLGVGGTGRVFRARDEQLGRIVALKVLTVSETDPAAQARWKRRLLREAQAAAALNHPNVVSVFDFGEVDDVSYIIMELVEGQSLRAFAGDASVFWKRRLRFLVDSARALRAVHAVGLVHRDVKPDNILVRNDGVVKLVDLGFAGVVTGAAEGAAPVLTESSSAGRGTIVGTPLYMAPEQLRGEECDGRSDQYSWGITAYEVLAGRPPWPATSFTQVLISLSHRTAPPPIPGVPEVVGATILRALATAPEARWPNLNAIIERLGPSAEKTDSTTRRLSATRSAEAEDRAGASLASTVRQLDLIPPSEGSSEAPRGVSLLVWTLVLGAAILALLILAGLWLGRSESPGPGVSTRPDAGIEVIPGPGN